MSEEGMMASGPFGLFLGWCKDLFFVATST